ncbi:MAG: DUF1850 domain-containing protein [Lachnospiraceae bacterium]|nr:DUF1850 domain-containing protein [Lachnospiraceae bacterium]
MSTKRIYRTAAVVLITMAAAAAVFFYLHSGYRVLTNAKSGAEYARYFVRDGDSFSVGFVHSVNKSPLTDYYELRSGKIYVEKTVYYGFGAGVQTEIEEGQKLEYGEDGSMIVSGFDREIPDLIYIVGTVSDHTLTVNEGPGISLRDMCGRNAMVRFEYRRMFE